MTCLLRAVPAAVPGIAFLSGGQSCELASARLNAMNVQIQVATAMGVGVFVCPRHPAARAGNLAGQEAVLAAQQALYHRARCNRAARRGEIECCINKT